MSYDKLNEKIMEMQEEIIKAVQGCVEIDSVKTAPEEGAPYGKGCREALDYALSLVKAWALRPETWETA